MNRIKVHTAFLLLLALFINNGSCVPSYVLCPDIDPRDRTVFFPHESNCTEFYRCDHGEALLQYCPSGLHWNADLDTCEFPWEAGCLGASGSNGGASGGTKDTSTGTAQDSSGGNKNICGNEGTSSDGGSCPVGATPTCPNPDPAYSVFFPHENDCHWFYHCSNGVAYCKSCPTGLHWNPALDTCDWPWQAGCTSKTGGSGGNGGNSGTSVTGNCPVPQPAFSIYFADPNDCTIFYECSHGVPYEQKCPANLHFNPQLNVCDEPEDAGCLAGTAGGDSGTANKDSGNDGDGTAVVVPATVCPSAPSPACPYADSATPLYFPHPTDSHWFFQCSHGVAYCKVCPAQLRWNQDKGLCDW